MLLTIALLAIVSTASFAETIDNTKTTTVKVQMIDGERKPFTPPDKVYLSVYNEHGDRVYENRQFHSDSQFVIALNLESSQTYHLVAHTTAYRKSISRGFKEDRSLPIDLKLLFMPCQARPIFASPDVKTLNVDDPNLWRVLFAGDNPEIARVRYDALREKKVLALAGYFSIAATVMTYKLPDASSLFDYYQSIDWAEAIAPRPDNSAETNLNANLRYDELFPKNAREHRGLIDDRFFAWANSDIIPVLEHLTEAHELKREFCPRLWGHPGATRSFKLVRYEKGNFQITLHENQTKVVGGIHCVLVETDVDYFSQLWRHALVEVLPHKIFRGLTNPRKVYVIEWHEMQSTGTNFEPPYGWKAVRPR
jgi:hypothetical protein